MNSWFWKDLEYPIHPSIQRSTVTQFLDVKGGIWREYNGLRLTMRQAEGIISVNKDICAVQNADNIIYNQICYHSHPDATGWMRHSMKAEQPESPLKKQISEIRDHLHEIAKAVNVIESDAEDSL